MSNDFTVKNKSVKVLLHRWLCWVASQWLPADWRLACLFIMHHQRWIRWKAYDGTETALIKSHRNYILPDLNTLSNYLTSSFHPFHLLSSTPKSLSSFFFFKLGKKMGLMRFSRGLCSRKCQLASNWAWNEERHESEKGGIRESIYNSKSNTHTFRLSGKTRPEQTTRS